MKASRCKAHGDRVYGFSVEGLGLRIRAQASGFACGSHRGVEQ